MHDDVLLADVCRYLEAFAPPPLAESWDNVGLLVGDASRSVRKVCACLTITPEVVDEAIAAGAQLIVAHHPMPFKPLKKITADHYYGGMLLKLIANQVAVFSPHTAFDSCRLGINQQLAAGLGLTDIAPLVASGALPDQPEVGSGRVGSLGRPFPLSEIVQRAKQLTGCQTAQVVGSADTPTQKIAVGCGAAGSFLTAAIEQEADCLVLGETNFHTCLEAKASNVSLILVGHYHSERFAVEELARHLDRQFAQVDVVISQEDVDPIRFV